MTKPTCAADGCNRPSEKVGFCSMHYKRWTKYGDASVGAANYGAAMNHLLTRYINDERGEECWEWPFSCKPFGYGQVRWCGRTVNVHRLVLRWDGRVDNNEVSRHTCDNPRCFNPGHLVAGAHADNTRDMLVRQRGKCAVSNEEAAELRRRFQRGERKVDLARELGVSRTTIGRLINGQTYRHV